jgi:hypothetical protein
MRQPKSIAEAISLAYNTIAAEENPYIASTASAFVDILQTALQ